MKKEISESEQTLRIMELIYVAQTDIEVCQIVYRKLYDREFGHNSPEFWLLMANNCFRSAVEILFTLLSSSKKEELRVEPLLNTGSLVDFNRVKDRFEGKKFHIFRHQSIAHKHKIIDDPAGMSRRLIQSQYRKELEEIIDWLRGYAQGWFNYEDRNPNDSIKEELSTLLNR